MTIDVYKIAQSFDRPVLADIPSAVADQMRTIAPKIARGSSIAIAVGSRGIANIAVIVKSVAAAIRQAGGRPFVVPAMGSHGGATAQGQAAVLDSYGVNERTTGVPVVSSMETVELDGGDAGCRVFMDAGAHAAQGIIAVNRIKPHTDYHGPYESGLVKMLVIGLGKHAQALEIHRYGVFGLRTLIPRAARRVIESGRILAGLAVVENAYDETAHVELVESQRILEREPDLLDMARRNMPSLPVEDIDILIIDRMGKDISGVGIDPNIIGRLMIRGEPEPAAPRIKSIVVSDLSDLSHGNALGTGLADVITRKLFEKINLADVYENVYTSTFLERAKIPVIAETDLRAFQFALRSCGSPSPDTLRLVRIRDTLHLGELYVSAAIRRELDGMARFTVTNETAGLFDNEGGLTPF